MPSSSNSTPRRPRSSSAPASRNTPPRPASGAPGKSGASGKPRRGERENDRTFDLTEPRRASSGKTAPRPATDAGVRRRELKKKRGRQSALVAWLLAVGASVMIGLAAAKVSVELDKAEGRVAQKRATLADLKTQFEIGKKRLKALNSASGKERVLVENGFVKPGQRLLLYPKPTPKEPTKTP
jgi:hypothetical protein